MGPADTRKAVENSGGGHVASPGYTPRIPCFSSALRNARTA